MLAMFIPLVVLYEISIPLARMVQPKKKIGVRAAKMPATTTPIEPSRRPPEPAARPARPSSSTMKSHG